MNPDEKRLSLVQSGKMAEIVLGQLGEKIRDRSSKAVDKLKANYRAGKIDAVTLSSGVAEIVALDDLYAELVRDVKTGNSASKEIHERSSTDNQHT